MSRRREPDKVGVTRSRYVRLMQVNIEHGYYANAGSEGACPDFNAMPTTPTAALMRSLGLLFLAESTGFSVLYDVNKTQSLLGYLRRHGIHPSADQTEQFWTRLSFVLSLNNLNFINFTEIPIGTNPTRSNFYFSNQDAQLDGADVVLNTVDAVLNKGEPVNAAQLMRVDGPEVRVVTPEGVDKVVALDIAGQSVNFEVAGKHIPFVPRCIGDVCRNIVYLDFATHDEDKYVIRTLGADGAILRQWPMLYTVSEPIPLCFIDLLFSQPTNGAAGVYPVENLYPEEDTKIIPVNYQLRFEARSTFWRYYIVPQPQDKELDDLAIETMGEGPPVSFFGPDKVKLVNGATAYFFVSNDRLMLQQQSTYRLRLKGVVRNMAAVDDVLVARLPVAAETQVLPEGGAEEPDENYSDIYVYV